ncbi:molybdenum cofactor biosynthesis protein MoaE [Alteraurantiacibacter buctensis]|uniref:Molybdopterin synthase catalytic subunit n=1 Tax=Alteraurantiacibacter buctensis TaxID=1503981 RepID=A0A844YXT8_9SPHN|nr:molybdenum cofactor biosynthesis protein MoaE [Alteraurantiacibacter buctensis]MXO71294.1 molybdenum cofactor biosynthesis protein MoaE [Alteraurantiacibacter buctensis]
MSRDVRLLTTPFDPATEIAAFGAAHRGFGGLCSFIGAVRLDGDVEALELLHYEAMTLPGMEALADEALARFGVAGLLIIHRAGIMHPGDPIVLVAAAGRHRREAIEAVDFAMDHLKSDSWFWKRELRGVHWTWIEPRAQDHSDLSRWG